MNKDDRLIVKVLSADTPEELFDIPRLEEQYKELVFRLHQDKCNHPQRKEAVAHLNNLREMYQNTYK